MMDTSCRIPDDVAATLVNAAAYADERLFDAHRWLRANLPFGHAAPEGYDPFWVATRHEDVREISRNNAMFLYAPRPSFLVDAQSIALTKTLTGGRPVQALTLLNMDEPDHAQLRKITFNQFAPKNLRTLQEAIDAIALQSVEHMLSLGGRCDFVRDVAWRYPLRVIMKFLGMPPEDEDFMLRITQEIFTPADEETLRAGIDTASATAEEEQRNAAIAEMGAYFIKLNEDRLKEPRGDVSSVLSTATFNGEKLNLELLLGYYGIIATAGHDTTSSSTAGAMCALAENPDLLQRVRANPDLIPALVEEAIRYTTPIKIFMRTVAEDIHFAGRDLKKDDWVMICYASANRDEAVFERPYVFDIDRRNNRDQIAFGYGGHVCLGQHLARQEMTSFFRQLLPRVASAELDGTPALSKSYFVNGHKTLPIKFTTN